MWHQVWCAVPVRLQWRSRQSRLKAQLCTDEEERRSLLKESEAGLRRCLVLDPADPRTYVVLGKLLMIQKRFDEARALYAEGVSNTGTRRPGRLFFDVLLQEQQGIGQPHAVLNTQASELVNTQIRRLMVLGLVTQAT